MQFRSADGIYKENPQRQKLYVCSNYPSCDTYVRVKDGTFEPIGTPANGPLRALRDRTHKEFDKIWKMNIMSRESAYEWLAITCGVSRRDAHIGNFRETMCEKVINMSRKLIDNQNQFPNK
jgi:ssDNA-binding Zn-finger/Zn-ribbon topoisomerase 1